MCKPDIKYKTNAHDDQYNLNKLNDLIFTLINIFIKYYLSLPWKKLHTSSID